MIDHDGHTVNGVPFMQGMDVSSLALSSREFGPTQATYACSGDRLTLVPVLPDGRSVQPMLFGRTG